MSFSFYFHLGDLSMCAMFARILDIHFHFKSQYLKLYQFFVTNLTQIQTKVLILKLLSEGRPSNIISLLFQAFADHI